MYNHVKELVVGNTPGTVCSHILSSSPAILFLKITVKKRHITILQDCKKMEIEEENRY